MKQVNFKTGFAIILTIMTAIGIIAANVDKLNAMGNGLDGLMGIALAIITIAIALPLWLCVITMWHKAHKTSYRAFKNWYFNLRHIITDAD